MQYNKLPKTESYVTAAQGVDDAVGVVEKHWYVAIVNNRAEQKTAEILSRGNMQGAYECYVPTQRETRLWKNGKKKIINRIVIPAMLFVRCTEAKRIESLSNRLVNRYMVDHGRQTGGHSPIAIIPDDQLLQFKKMLAVADTPVTIEPLHYHLGDKVKVKSGQLQGIVGHVLAEPTATYLCLRLESLGYAKVLIDKNEVERVE